MHQLRDISESIEFANRQKFFNIMILKMLFFVSYASTLVACAFLYSKSLLPFKTRFVEEISQKEDVKKRFFQISLLPTINTDNFVDSNSEDPGIITKMSEDRRFLELDYKRLIEQMLTETNPLYIPSLLTKNAATILAVVSTGGVQIVDSILKDTIKEYGNEFRNNITQAIDLTISFAEDIAAQAHDMEEQHKKLLGKIIRAVSNKGISVQAREEALDELFHKQRDQFTAGFLRHVEGQCSRISSATKPTTDSYKMLEILKLIQTRILEELISGSEWSEAAQVLGQLIGYDNKAERVAVLEAGLAVRGPKFGEKLIQLTDEALEGFKSVPGGADPSLVAIVEDLNGRIKRHHS